MQSKINAAPATIAVALALLAAMAPAAVQAKENAYAAHRLVWAPQEEHDAVSVEAVSSEEVSASNAQRLMRTMERNSAQMINRLSRDIDARLMEAFGARAY